MEAFIIEFSILEKQIKSELLASRKYGGHISQLTNSETFLDELIEIKSSLPPLTTPAPTHLSLAEKAV